MHIKNAKVRFGGFRIQIGVVEDGLSPTDLVKVVNLSQSSLSRCNTKGNK